ncbi:MAG: hypothetical protein L0H83_09880, partial [Salinisphaera sp.]|nr:hypothetical protein [Salinisphaera sp.]
KPLADESTPAGNGIAAQALLRLGWLVGEPRHLAAAQRTLELASESMTRYPLAHASLLAALQDYLQPPPVVILRGADDKIVRWRNALKPTRAQIYAIPAPATGLPPALANKTPRGEVVAYLCRGSSCSPPVTDLNDLTALIR